MIECFAATRTDYLEAHAYVLRNPEETPEGRCRFDCLKGLTTSIYIIAVAVPAACMPLTHAGMGALSCLVVSSSLNIALADELGVLDTIVKVELACLRCCFQDCQTAAPDEQHDSPPGETEQQIIRN